MNDKKNTSKNEKINLPKLPKLAKKPKVSICTPTFNRRPFIPFIIKCIEHQTYPKDKIEWIIVDDGTDSIYDLVKHIPYVKYYGKNELNLGPNDKLRLGRKRNISHEYCTGDIILYMDDDDYYHPERISHAIYMLQQYPKAWISGCSEMHIYFKHINKMYQFGPYLPMGPFKCSNHSTAASFAFRRELLKYTKYNDDASLAEETEFLKKNTIPLIQLDPKKTILVFSHNHNSFDKKGLLDQIGKTSLINPSPYTVDDFITSKELKNFYMNDIDEVIKNYDFGNLTNKPDVISQINEIKKKREDIIKTKEKMDNINYNANIEIIKSVSKIMEHKIKSNNNIENENKILHNEIIDLSKIIKSHNKEKYELELKTYAEIGRAHV